MTDVATAILTRDMSINKPKKECWVNVYKTNAITWLGRRCDSRTLADQVALNVYISSATKCLYRIHVRLK